MRLLTAWRNYRRKALGLDVMDEKLNALIISVKLQETWIAQILSHHGDTPQEYRQPDKHLPARNRYGL